MTVLDKKIDFALVIQVIKANPNGDPLDSNRPRVDFNGYGEISDVCLKRKIRDRAIDCGMPIFVVSSEKVTDGCKSLHDRFDFYVKNGGKCDPLSLCQQWFDVRAFGQVFAFKGKDKGSKEKGAKDKEAKEAGVSIPVRGPVTIQCATSLEPVSVSSIQITKSVNSETTDDGKKSSDTMGMKHRIDKGTYVAFGAISPQLSVKTGFSYDDAQTLKNLLIKLFDGDASSARPEGSMTVKYLIWWEQDSSNKVYSSFKVHQSLRDVLHSAGADYDSLLTEKNLFQSKLESIITDLRPEIIEGN